MEKFYLQIEDYLLGELSEGEKTLFELELNQNEDLARAVAAQRQLQERLEAKALRKRVQLAIESIKTPKNQLRKSTYLTIAMIGVFLLGFGYWFWPRPAREENNVVPTPPQKEEIFAEKPNTAPAPPVDPELTPAAQTPSFKPLAMAYYKIPPNDQLRGDQAASQPNSTLELARTAFYQKNYPKASALLEPESLVSSDDASRYLRAHARFNAKLYQKAANDFLKLQQSFEYKYDAQWNLLLCYLALGPEKEMAIKQLLQQMTSNKDHPFYTEARKIKSQLSF
jgi:hypothetical protein